MIISSETMHNIFGIVHSVQPQDDIETSVLLQLISEYEPIDETDRAAMIFSLIGRFKVCNHDFVGEVASGMGANDEVASLAQTLHDVYMRRAVEIGPRVSTLIEKMRHLETLSRAT